MIDAILIDWDDTLADSRKLIHQALKNTFEHFSLKPWTVEEIQSRSAQSARDYFPSIFGHDAELAIAYYRQQYYSKAQNIELIDGALDTLNFLLSAGIYTAVISNKLGSTLRSEIDHLELNKYFKAVVGSGDTDQDKPSSKPLIKAMNNYTGHIDKSNMYFVGDSYIDVMAAENYSIQSILINNLDTNIKPTYRVKNHKELIDLLKKL